MYLEGPIDHFHVARGTSSQLEIQWHIGLFWESSILVFSFRSKEEKEKKKEEKQSCVQIAKGEKVQ